MLNKHSKDNHQKVSLLEQFWSGDVMSQLQYFGTRTLTPDQHIQPSIKLVNNVVTSRGAKLIELDSLTNR